MDKNVLLYYCRSLKQKIRIPFRLMIFLFLYLVPLIHITLNSLSAIFLFKAKLRIHLRARHVPTVGLMVS